MNTAVDSANAAMSARMVSPRESSRRCRTIAAATTPERPPASGRARAASGRRPRIRPVWATRQMKSAPPVQNSRGARRVKYETDSVGTPSGTTTTW